MGGEPPTKSSKKWGRGGGLIRSKFLEGSCWEKGGDLFQGEVAVFT